MNTKITLQRTVPMPRTSRHTRQTRPERRREDLRAFTVQIGKVPVNVGTSLLHETVELLLDLRADMCQRGELAGRIVSYLESARLRS
jgi:hypothetical protein